MDGGAGNDTYAQKPGSADLVIDSQGIDWLDLGGADFAVILDLAAVSVPQVIDSAGNTLTLSGIIENVSGSSYSDRIKGNAERNILRGGGGIDILDGDGAADTLQGGYPQTVYLDFESASGRGEKAYSIEERNAIQARLEQDFAAPFTITFTQTAPPVGKYTTILVNAGDSLAPGALVAGEAFELDWRNVNPTSRANINVNAFLGRRGQPAATSENYIGLTVTVIAHELAHLFGLRHHDAFGPLGINPGTGIPFGVYAGILNRGQARNETDQGRTEVVPGDPREVMVYALKHAPVLLENSLHAGQPFPTRHDAPSGKVFDGEKEVATFIVSPNGSVQITNIVETGPKVLEGTLDTAQARLKLTWSAKPASSSIQISYDFDSLRPGYRGPLDGVETPQHVLASPAAVGSNLADAVLDTYFGERELIKLAFADASKSSLESELFFIDAPSQLGGSARNLNQLPGLAVPSLLTPNATNAYRSMHVRAANVIGSIGRTAGGTGPSENDLYAFQGRTGELLTVEVLSASLQQRMQMIDSVLRVYGPDGNLLDYYGQPAVNDDGLDNQDSLLIDVLLPSDGTYFIQVDTFSSSTVPDMDTGGYELFLYTYTTPSFEARQTGAGDTIIGGPGTDVMIGSAGDDRFIADLLEDQILGRTPQDFVGLSTPSPTVSITDIPANPMTGEPVLLKSTVENVPEGSTIGYLWVVSRGGQIISRGGEPTFSFTPVERGNYTVTLTITDDFNATGSDTEIITAESPRFPATITGNATGSVTEDALENVASGKLTVTDPNPGESVFQIPPVLSGIYGTFTFNSETGDWSYALDNHRPATNALGDGQIAEDVLLTVSLDGSASQPIVIKITGADETDFDPPLAVLVGPTPNQLVALDNGYIDIQWTDAGLAGIDPSSWDIADATINGVSVDRIEPLGNGLVRYFYGDEEERLTPGRVEVRVVAGQVFDYAGNSNSGLVQSFVQLDGVCGWRNPIDEFDTSYDGMIAPIDALLIINELNDPTVIASDGRLVPLGAPPNFPPTFFDVNCDGFTTPLDALHIIDYLNRLVGGEAEGKDVAGGVTNDDRRFAGLAMKEVRRSAPGFASPTFASAAPRSISLPRQASPHDELLADFAQAWAASASRSADGRINRRGSMKQSLHGELDSILDDLVSDS